ncbi:UDP-glycosyltransferase 91C1 [Striga hermonthica]|uniref:Glycosyltransferase n=1 Tax=Striga hermonthica TaxID=68872 RepID=A0A9N7NMU3_STRHE|nr:UDP-glycosyltransferase 91C1 [Striga hermonthica]
MVAKRSISTILMFPYIAHGHVFPFFELAKKLSKKNFHIYFCSTSVNLDSVRQHLENLPSNDGCEINTLSIELVELRLPAPPELPPIYHTTKNVPPHLMQTLKAAFHASSSIFSDILAMLNPDLLIFDLLQPWSARLATSKDIPSVYFLTSGSAGLSFDHHLFSYGKFDNFPFLPSICLKDYELKASIESAKEFPQDVALADDEDGFMFGVFRLSHDIVIAKTCRAIESKYMDYLSSLCRKKIVPTGPLVTVPDSISEPIIEWLDMKEPSSTLYISFGSESYLSGDQMRQLAKGLELARVDFIWVVRSPVGMEDHPADNELPEGFVERSTVTRRGMILRDWAPQAEILAHPSVGGFVSHCGWSSVIESIYFGVPVLGVPLKYDQPLNCRLVVEAGVGVEVGRGENGEFDGEKVARAIEEVVFGGEGFRVRVRELSKKMRMEEDEGDEVADELRKLIIRSNMKSSAAV